MPDEQNEHGPQDAPDSPGPAQKAPPPGCGCATCGTDGCADETSLENEDPATRSLSKALSTSFKMLKLIMVLLLGLFLIDCVTFVNEGNIGLVRRFGAYLRDGDGRITRYNPGSLVFVWPDPIETLEEVSIRNRVVDIDSIFWPQVEKRRELQPDRQAAIKPVETLDPARDGYNLTGDLNIVHSRWTAQYKVVDPVRYQLAVALPEDPDPEDRTPVEVREALRQELVRKLVAAAIFKNVAGMSVDAVLYTDANRLFHRIESDAAAMLEAGNYGIELIRVSNVGGGLAPPGKTQPAFSKVIGAKSRRETLIQQSRTEANTLRQKAEADADQIRKEAEDYKSRIVHNAEGDARRLRDLLAEFPDDPQTLRLYLTQYRYDQLRDILKNTRHFLVRPGQNWYIMGGAPEMLDDEDENDNRGGRK